MTKDIYTTSDVAELFKVYTTTVVDWITSGKLKAFQTPGGHYRIHRSDLTIFLKERHIPLSSHWAEKVRILLVDDEKTILKLMQRVLAKSHPDWSIRMAENGFEAGKEVMEFLPDLVVLDLQLPGIDGFDVCRNIRKTEQTKGTKILAISGYNTPENRERVLSVGADDFLGKPFEVKEFEERVRRLL